MRLLIETSGVRFRAGGPAKPKTDYSDKTKQATTPDGRPIWVVRLGDRWHDNDLVFASRKGTALWAGNVRRSFRTVTAAAGLDSADWTPRELRHSFVSLLSDAGVPIEKIARLVGHTGTVTTEAVYRKQIRPVVTGGAEVMDSLFPKQAADA